MREKKEKRRIGEEGEREREREREISEWHTWYWNSNYMKETWEEIEKVQNEAESGVPT